MDRTVEARTKAGAARERCARLGAAVLRAAGLAAALGACDAGGPASGGPTSSGVSDAALPDAARVEDGAIDAPPDAAATVCDPGFHLVRDVRRCDPAVATPAALAASLATTAAGDPVPLADVTTASLPCAPARVCAPDAARTLVFSDDPEDPAVNGVLYADTLRKGAPYRIYVYHANGGAAPRKFSLVALNQGAAAASVRFERSAVGTPGVDYLGIGKDVARRYLGPPSPRTVVVPAGARVVLDPALDAATAQRLELVHAIYDVTPDADLKLSVVTVGPGVDAAAATAGLPLLPFDGKHARGTFPDADLAIFASSLAGPAGSKLARLRLGADVVDPHVLGRDATTGNAISLVGNFGVVYTIVAEAGMVAGVAPRGGAWAGATEQATVVTALPRGSTFVDADAVRLPNLAPGGALRLMTAGSSSLPVDVVVTSGR